MYGAISFIKKQNMKTIKIPHVKSKAKKTKYVFLVFVNEITCNYFCVFNYHESVREEAISYTMKCPLINKEAH